MLIPRQHLRFNPYWSGQIGRSERPLDPRKKYAFARVHNCRHKLSRYDGRRDRALIHGDSRAPLRKKYFGKTLESHIEMLQHGLAVVLRLRFFHVAGDYEIKSLTRDHNRIVTGQLCSTCGRGIKPPRLFDVPTELEPDLIDEVSGFWKPGIRLLEHWKSTCIDDSEWWVLEPNEPLREGYVPCTVLSDL